MTSLLTRWLDGARVEVYTVHEPPDPPADRIERGERLHFVRDGFSWGAALLGPVWLALRGAWAGLAAYLAAAIVLGAAIAALGLPEAWTAVSLVALNIYLGFEASGFERWSLERAGWSELGTVSGRSMAECERRFLESWLPEQPLISALKGFQSAEARPAATVEAASAQGTAGPGRHRWWRG
jgi:hypothetical protein